LDEEYLFTVKVRHVEMHARRSGTNGDNVDTNDGIVLKMLRYSIAQVSEIDYLCKADSKNEITFVIVW